MELPKFAFDNATEIVSSENVEQAIAAYVNAGLQPILIHAPTVGGGCTCGKSGCTSAGKHPIAKKWQRRVSHDELRDQIARLKFTPNVGVVLGEQPSGAYLVAIDVDDEKRFNTLVEQWGPLNETPRGESGRGYRLFFELPPDIPRDRVRNVSGLGGEPGVDVKVKAGQVVVAPSMHASGRRYTWTRTGTIAVLALTWAMELMTPAPVPDWISEYTPQTLRENKRAVKRAERYLEKSVLADARLISQTGQGLRNETLKTRSFALYSLSAGLWLGNSGWDFVRRELSNAAIAAGLPAKEVRDLLARTEQKVSREGIVRVPVSLQTPSGDAEPPTDPGTLATTVEVNPLETIRLEMDRGFPAKIANNVARLLAQHPVWSGGPAFDAYSQTPLWPLPLPEPIAEVNRYHREVTDADFDAIQGWIMTLPETHRVRGGIEIVHGGVRLAASRRKVDLLAQYVLHLAPWDGVYRIDSWLVDYLGCEDNLYSRATGRAWIVAAIERALVPGITVDLIPILEGDQGVGKNRALEALFEGGPRHAPWLTIIAGHRLDQDETKRLACTRWVLHDDELQARDPRRVDSLKSWASRPRETYRIQYERTITTSPRRALLAGSINQKQYLHDDTGNRRWFPWAVKSIRVDALAKIREQIFAEALYAVQSNGEQWRTPLTPEVRELAAIEAEKRRHHDPLGEQIDLILNGYNLHGEYTGVLPPAELTTHMIGVRLGYRIDNIDRSLEMRISSAMRGLGYWTKKEGGKRIFTKKNDGV